MSPTSSLRTFLLLALLIITAGCYGRGRAHGEPPGSDGGSSTSDNPVIMTDGGTTVVATDGGSGDDHAMATGCAAGCPAGQMCSGSACVPVPRTCRAHPLTSVSGVYCAAETRTCVDSCPDGDCVGECLLADPSPDCYGCALQNSVACANARGCQPQWDCINSCAEDLCPEGSSDACVEVNCGSELEAWTSCRAATDCGIAWATCLP